MLNSFLKVPVVSAIELHSSRKFPDFLKVNSQNRIKTSQQGFAGVSTLSVCVSVRRTNIPLLRNADSWWRQVDAASFREFCQLNFAGLLLKVIDQVLLSVLTKDHSIQHQ